MKPLLVTILGLVCAATLRADNSWVGVLPPDLRSAEEHVLSRDENALFLAVAQISDQNEAEAKRWRDALTAVKNGRISEDADLIRRAEEIHAKTEKFAHLPSRFPVSIESPEGKRVLRVMGLFRAEELLARQAALQGDREKMDRHIDILLAWNRSLRQARPNLVDWALCSFPWAAAFDLLLEDWQNHPDQARRLREITERFEKTRVGRNELIGVLRADFDTVVDMGPLPEMLQGWKEIGRMSVLNPPFDAVPIEELLKLPYDQKATIEASVAKLRQQLSDIASGKPFAEWAEVRRNVPSRTLDDYRKMPNGLYRLQEEQLKQSSTFSVMGGAEMMDAQMATCLHWLEAERAGREFVSGSPEIAQDPMNGKPLRVEVKSRLIRSVGGDFQVNQGEAVPARVGFHRVLQDPALRVPVWR